MTSITAYKLFACPDCGQIHVDPIYGTFNFMGHSLPQKNKSSSDLIVCQKCSARRLLSDYGYLGSKERPKNKQSYIKKLLGNLSGAKPVPNPGFIYPQLSNNDFDAEWWVNSFKNFGMTPKQFPEWFKALTAASHNTKHEKEKS